MFLRREAGECAGAVEPRHAVDHDPDQGKVEVSHPGTALRVTVPAVMLLLVVVIAVFIIELSMNIREVSVPGEREVPSPS